MLIRFSFYHEGNLKNKQTNELTEIISKTSTNQKLLNCLGVFKIRVLAMRKSCRSEPLLGQISPAGFINASFLVVDDNHQLP